MALYYPEDKIAASNYVRAAIPLMMKNDIAPNPCNYALWYSYVSNRDRQLKHKLDKTIEESGTCPDKVSQELFQEFIVKEETELMKNIESSLSDVVSDLMGGTASTRQAVAGYSKNLEQALETLNPDMESEQISQMVEGLLKATKEEHALMSSFESQMQAAELEIQSLRQQLKEREIESTTDPLTQIANRRGFDEHLYQLANTNDTFSLILIDLDHFKKLNDTYGHPLGDKVLKGMGQLLKKICPANAYAARYGGEEFAVLVNGSLKQAEALAEQIRSTLAQVSIKKNGSTEVIQNITASFGVAESTPKHSPEALIGRADKALYEAKEGGRNQVMTASPAKAA